MPESARVLSNTVPGESSIMCTRELRMITSIVVLALITSFCNGTTLIAQDDSSSEELSRRAVARLRISMSRYDKNGDGLIDEDELESVGTSAADALKESDTDGDGNLSRDELAARYAERFPKDGRFADQQRNERDEDSDREVGQREVDRDPGKQETDPQDDERWPELPEDVRRRLITVLSDYDTNGDEVLDADELKDANNGEQALEESDLDKDGSLSANELIVRYSTQFDEGDESGEDEPEMSDRGQKTEGGRETDGDQESHEEEVSGRVRDILEGVLGTYDANGNGELDADELAESETGARALGESDSNGDGKLSRDELIARYRERVEQEQSDNTDEGDTVDGGRGDREHADQDEEIAPDVREILVGVLDAYDANGNGELDADELSESETGASAIEESDTNGDGKLDHQELIVRYRKRVAAQRDQSDESEGEADEGDEQRREAREILMERMRAGQELLQEDMRRRNERRREDRSREEMLREEMLRQMKEMQGRGGDRRAPEAFAEDRPMSAGLNVTVVLLPEDINAEEIVDRFQGVSTENANRMVKRLASAGSNVDRYSLNGLNGREARVSNQASGTIVGNDGSTSEYQTGTVIELVPEFRRDQTLVEMHFEKSVIDRKVTDAGGPEFLEFSYQGAFTCNNDRPMVVSSSSNGRNWLIMVNAER